MYGQIESDKTFLFLGLRESGNECNTPIIIKT